MEILIPIAVIAVLVLANGLFVAAEFAIIGVPRTAIERRAAQGSKAARKVHDILDDPRRQDLYITTAQLGITLASLGLGMYGEHALGGWIAHALEAWEIDWLTRWIAAHTLATALAVGILTYLHIVIGEMVPKSVALMHAEGTALWITRPMLWFKWAMYPLVIGLNGIGNAFLRLFGIRREVSTSHFHTPEDLEFIVRESEEGGLLRSESGQVLRELLDFGDLTARKIMEPRVRVVGLPLGATPTELAEILRQTPHTRYPVYEGDLDHILGVVHVKDAMRLLRQGSPLTEAAVRPTAFVPETLELDGVLDAMRRARTQLVVVMDEHGGTGGIVSIEDLCAEALGDVEEGADERPDIEMLADGRLRASGAARLDEIGEAFDLDLEHEEVDTLSGLVLALLERPAAVGDAVTFENLRFEVSAVEGNGVDEALVTLLPPPEEPENAGAEET